MDLEILGPSEDLAAARVRTWKRFLAGVNSDVVNQLVLGFERLVGAFTTAPVAGVIRLFRSAHVIDGQMSHQLHHRRESSTAFRRRRTCAL